MDDLAAIVRACPGALDRQKIESFMTVGGTRYAPGASRLKRHDAGRLLHPSARIGRTSTVSPYDYGRAVCARAALLHQGDLKSMVMTSYCGLPPTLAGVSCAADHTRSREWHFRVLLDGKPIGWHDFRVNDADGSAEVVSHARFVVTVLHIPIYRYEHKNLERWRGGCLAQIDAETTDNGRSLRVHGEATADSFTVSGPSGARSWAGCVRSFAYWDRTLLAAQRLLNAQTGAYEPVRLERAPGQGDMPGSTERYFLDGPDFHIELWYRVSGEWCGLATQTSGGKTLRYEILH